MSRSYRILAGILVMIMFMAASITPVQAASKPLPLDAKVTKKNVLALLKKYDRDGYYILKYTANHGDDFMQWFSRKSWITYHICPAVHEQNHGYTADGRYGYLRYYQGNKKSIVVKRTKIFRTKKMAKSIPKNLRTSRYDTYIGKPSKYLGANIEGVYGLMDEFYAYSWGMNTAISLFDYYRNFPVTMDTWNNYIVDASNGRLAYAEFKYYILFYMTYAQKHYPKVYKGILRNKKFCKAYKNIEKRYASYIDQYDDQIQMLCDMSTDEQRIYINGEYLEFETEDGGEGAGILSEEYEILMKELQKDKYQKMHERIIQHS